MRKMMMAAVLLVGCAQQHVAMAKEEPQATHHAAKAVKTYKGFGRVVVVKDGGNWVTLDGVVMAIDEKTPQATVYFGGLNQVIIYRSGKVALMKEGQLVGWMK